eukprot:989157-Prorocentrum_minimum.AAC.1
MACFTRKRTAAVIRTHEPRDPETQRPRDPETRRPGDPETDSENFGIWRRHHGRVARPKAPPQAKCPAGPIYFLGLTQHRKIAISLKSFLF